MNAKHQSHPDIIKRLKRSEGHLRSVIEMIGEGRSCLDVAQQLHAVEKAVAEAKKTFIVDDEGFFSSHSPWITALHSRGH